MGDLTFCGQTAVLCERRKYYSTGVTYRQKLNRISIAAKLRASMDPSPVFYIFAVWKQQEALVGCQRAFILKTYVRRKEFRKGLKIVEYLSNT